MHLSDAIVIPVLGSNALVIELSVSVKHSNAVVAESVNSVLVSIFVCRR